MASAKAFLGGLMGRFLFREASVVSVEDVAPRFRLAAMNGDALKDIEWTPGDKVQVFLGDAGFRTYTPLKWDAAKGETSFLIYVHGASTPGAIWGSKLAKGDRCQLFGPRGSIAFPTLSDPVVLVGDETSIAAACALRDVKAAATSIFEVDDVEASRAALSALGLSRATAVARESGADALAKEIRAALDAMPNASLVFTGKAQTIQALKSRGLRATKTKAYWSVGKAGLD